METKEAAVLNQDEIVELAAVDPMFYSQHFFPKAFRSEPALVHPDVWEKLESHERYVALKLARDLAKTTTLRSFASRRIAFAVSRTILFVGKSEEAAKKSLDWLQRAVLWNHAWRQTFGIEKGKQWSNTEIDIYNAVMDVNIRVLAIGITGSTRGINVDDYRPDLIIVDDPCDEENTATPEQRKKISDLFFGSLYNSLAPRMDMPEAMMCLLQTPLDGQDLIEQCMSDPMWASAEYSIFDEGGNSVWPARYPTEELKHEKEGFVQKGQLAVWMREKEVKIVDESTTTFRKSWLRFWGSGPGEELLPEGGVNYLAIDPTPPPRERNETSSSKLLKRDNFVILAFKVYKGEIYLLEEWAQKSPSPEEWKKMVFEMVVRWKVRRVSIETILFARTMKYDLEEEMRKEMFFFQVWPIEDKRNKKLRIESEISGIASARALIIHRSHKGFYQEYINYPVVPFDDHLDCLAIGRMGIIPGLEESTDPQSSRQAKAPPAKPLRRAP